MHFNTAVNSKNLFIYFQKMNSYNRK